MEVYCSIGEAGCGIEIDDIKEITFGLLSEGIYECMTHEFLFEDQAEEALSRCGYIRESSEKLTPPSGEKLMSVLKEMLSPMEVKCTIDGEAFELSEEIKNSLEEQYIKFAVDWILDWKI